MPLTKCSADGKSGYKWGDSGHCYTGPDAKKQAIKQGVAVEGPGEFKKKVKADRETFQGDNLQIAAAALREYERDPENFPKAEETAD